MDMILFPGWGIAVEEYSALKVDRIIDYGFFYDEKSVPDLMNPDEWLDSIQPEKPYTLIAHSMGALFVLRSSQLRDNAEEIIIVGGFAKFAESEDNPYGKPPSEPVMMQKQLKRNPKALLKSFYRAVAAPERLKIAVSDTLNISQLHIGLELLKNCDIRKDLESIKVPVRIMHGKDDLIVSAKLAEYLHSKIKKSSLELFSEKGHWLIGTSSKIC